MSATTFAGIWYLGDLAPRLRYLKTKLIGMAVAVPSFSEESQKWEAFDMRSIDHPELSPILLGTFDDVNLAVERIEQVWADADSYLNSEVVLQEMPFDGAAFRGQIDAVRNFAEGNRQRN